MNISFPELLLAVVVDIFAGLKGHLGLILFRVGWFFGGLNLGIFDCVIYGGFHELNFSFRVVIDKFIVAELVFLLNSFGEGEFPPILEEYQLD